MKQKIKQIIIKILHNKGKSRVWYKITVIPFIIKKKKGATIRRFARLDLLPTKRFELGINSVVEDFTTINNGVGDVIIGDNTRIGIGNTIIGPVAIGNHVHLAQNIVLSGLNHNFQDARKTISQQGVNTKSIFIDNNCWIGANTVILAGVSIGEGSVIGAGSVVTKNIPKFSLAVGNPARVIKQLNPETESWEKVVPKEEKLLFTNHHN